MRVAIYARFSSDLQDARSITDQVTMARDRASREGWSVAGEFCDAALSGAHMHNRPGLMDLMVAVAAKRCDAVLTESIDRISRDQGDVVNFYKELSFRSVKLITLADGEVTKVFAGLKGLVASIFLDDLAQKTRRGHMGRVKAGRVPGSLAYGYVVVREGEERGLRRIDPVKADIIRRIFRDYAVGVSPHAIARALNAEGVPAPAGGLWQASTLVGSQKRQSGLINNRNYVGKLVYNRQRFVKHPTSGKRHAQVNNPADWIEQDAPDLAIVPVELFESAQARRAHLGSLGRAKRNRPKHLLSGLIRCGCCGANMIVLQHDRVGCSARRTGGCDSARTIALVEIEERVLRALEQHLLTPERVAEFIDTYRRERQRLVRERARLRSTVERDLAEVSRKIEALLRLAEEGGGEGKALARRIGELEMRQQELERQRPRKTDLDVVDLHPQAAARYQEIVARVRTALSAGTTASAEAIGLVRELIETITVIPTPKGTPLRLEMAGNLALLMQVPEPNGNTVPMALVAGGGLEPPTYGL